MKGVDAGTPSGRGKLLEQVRVRVLTVDLLAVGFLEGLMPSDPHWGLAVSEASGWPA